MPKGAFGRGVQRYMQMQQLRQGGESQRTRGKYMESLMEGERFKRQQGLSKQRRIRELLERTGPKKEVVPGSLEGFDPFLMPGVSPGEMVRETPMDYGTLAMGLMGEGEAGAGASVLGKVPTSLDIYKAQTARISATKPVAGQAPKTPTPPMYMDVPISDTQQQKYRWNPQTGMNDIPVGKPRPIFAPKTPGEKKTALKQIAGDYFETVRQMNSAMRGVDVYMPTEFRAPTEKVIGESQKRLDILAKRYVELGGDIKELARMPVEEPSGPLLPEGLTEEAINFYVSKHRMTREEVIQKYITKMSQQ